MTTKKTATERQVALALALSKWAKAHHYRLSEINPAFGPMLQLNYRLNSVAKKGRRPEEGK